YGGSPSDTSAAEATRSVTPEAGGDAVAFLHLWEDKAVTAPTGFAEHAKMTHPDDALVTLAVYSGPVVADTPYVWSWSGSARSALRMYVFDGIDLTAPVAGVEIAATDGTGQQSDTFTDPVRVDSTGTLAVVAYVAGDGGIPFDHGFPSTLSNPLRTWSTTPPRGQLTAAWFLPVEGLPLIPYPRISRDSGTSHGGVRVSAMIVLNRAAG